jgi:hypothetical protein
LPKTRCSICKTNAGGRPEGQSASDAAHGVDAIDQKPDTSRPANDKESWPYLLGRQRMGRPKQVWGADISCIQMCCGFRYPADIVDWFPRETAPRPELSLGFRQDRLSAKGLVARPL